MDTKYEAHKSLATIERYLVNLLEDKNFQEANTIFKYRYPTLCKRYKSVFQTNNELDSIDIKNKSYERSRKAWNRRKERIKKTYKWLTEKSSPILSPASEIFF